MKDVEWEDLETNWEDLETNFDWDFSESNEKEKISFDKKQSDISRGLDFFNYSEAFKLKEKFQMIKEIDFPIPKINEQIHFMTAKKFNLFDILDFIILKNGEPDYLLISFFTANKEMIYRANDYSKKYNCEICLSDILNTKRFQEIELKNLMEFKFFFANNHAKIILCKIKDDYFILSGSLNSGNNARIEQLILSNNKKIFDFYQENFLYIKENFGKKRNDIF